MKLLNQLKQQLENAKEEAKALALDKNATLEQINAKKEEIQALKAKIQVIEETEDEEPSNSTPLKTYDPNDSLDYGTVFMKAFKGDPLNTDEQALMIQNSLSSATGEDGGYLIPIDQQTAIKELKRDMQSLEDLVNVEPVSTLSGSRNIEKDAEHTPFTEFTEGQQVPTADSPQFVNISYAIKDRGGILPVPNNLWNDNTANLKAYLNKWLAKKQVATRNSLIINLLNALPKTAIASIDDVKNVFNVTLDSAISAMSYVIMNQDAFNKFDKMKDNDGNYLLQKDPTNPTQKLLDGKPIKVFSNKTLKTRNDSGTKKAPVIFGNLKEAITLFDREALSLLATNIGGDAFKFNRTDIRGITREDVKSVDTGAVVFGEIVVE